MPSPYIYLCCLDLQICGVIVFNVAIGMVQEGRAEKAAEAIKVGALVTTMMMTMLRKMMMCCQNDTCKIVLSCTSLGDHPYRRRPCCHLEPRSCGTAGNGR